MYNTHTYNIWLHIGLKLFGHLLGIYYSCLQIHIVTTQKFINDQSNPSQLFTLANSLKSSARLNVKDISLVTHCSHKGLSLYVKYVDNDAYFYHKVKPDIHI